MKVSIIVPVFNAENYLNQSIKSLINQTYKNLEIILVDDGSTDNSRKICEKYKKKDDRIKIIYKEKSEGAGLARNSGIDIATGDLIMFLDADDWISENMVKRLCKEQSKENVDVVICGYETFIEGISNKYNQIIKYDYKTIKKKDELKKFFVSFFPEGIVGYLWNKLYKTSIIKKNNLQFPDMRRLQDGVFNVNYFNCINSCSVIEDILYHYRINQQVDMFRKCPSNYYDLIKIFSQNYIKIKDGWGNFSNKKIITFFMNEFVTCIENSYSPNWNMSKKQRNKYFVNLKKDSFLKFALNETFSIGKYRRWVIFLFKLNMFSLIGFTVKIKVLFKSSTKKIYYFIKGIK